MQLALGDLHASAATFERAAAAAAARGAGLPGAAGLLDSPDAALGTGGLAEVGPPGAAGAGGAAVLAGGAAEGADPGVNPGDPDGGRAEAGGAAGLEALVRRNRGLQLFAEADYKGASHASSRHLVGLAFAFCRGVSSKFSGRYRATAMCPATGIVLPSFYYEFTSRSASPMCGQSGSQAFTLLLCGHPSA